MTKQIRFALLCSLGIAVVFAVFAPAAMAQAKTNIQVTGDNARRTLTKGEISGDAAKKISDMYEEFAKKHNYFGTIVILDPFGGIIHAHRMDGARPVQLDGAITKAQTSLFYRRNTHELADEIVGKPVEQAGFWLDGYHPTPGGIPIVLNNQLIGVIGVTGSDPWDEEGAYTALNAVLGIPIPAGEKLKWETPPPGAAPAAQPAR